MQTKPCVVCGAVFETKRGNAKYCSEACRCKAYRARKAGNKGIHSRVLNSDELDDLRTIASLSFESAEVVIQIATVAGAEAARHVLDGYWALMVACGVDIAQLQKSA